MTKVQLICCTPSVATQARSDSSFVIVLLFRLLYQSEVLLLDFSAVEHAALVDHLAEDPLENSRRRWTASTPRLNVLRRAGFIYLCPSRRSFPSSFTYIMILLY